MFKLVHTKCDKCSKEGPCVLIQDPHNKHWDEDGDYDLIALCKSCLAEEMELPKKVIGEELDRKQY
jgi:hypothetical protein